MKSLGVAAALVGFLPLLVLADVGPPAHMQVTEREPALYRVEWRVPKVLPPRAVPTPVLPESCRPAGEREVTDQPSAWILSRDWRCDVSLAGQPLGIRYPFADLALTTVIRVNLLSGDRFAHVSSPGEGPWHVPEGTAPPDPVAGARRAVSAGTLHAATSWIHAALALALALLGGLGLPVRLVTLFTLAQLAGVALSAGSGISLPPALGEAGVAVAAALVAREILRPAPERRSLARVFLATGLLHGLAVSGVVAGSLGDDPGLASLVVATVGVDAAHLIGVGLFLLLLLRPAERREAGGRRVATAAYATGAASLAFALALALGGGRSYEARPITEPLPGQGTLSGALAPRPASQRLASSSPDAPVQSFLAVEPFEVRHEVMLRLGGLAGALGLESAQVLPVEDQPAVVDSLVRLVLGSARVTSEGPTPEPSVRRADFMTVDPTGALPRPTAVSEEVAEAVVGIVVSYPTGGIPDQVVLEWRWFPESAAGIPVTTIDPENARSALLTPDEPSLRWENNLVDDPVPSVQAVSIEPARLPVPLLSLPLFVVAAALVVAGIRGTRSTVTLSAARIVLAAAFLLGPVVRTSVALPGTAGHVPSERQARRILSGLLPNVYRALEFRDEATVYDRLAVSVAGGTLTDVYLEQRRALELEERGGAQARVETVDVLEASDVRRDEEGFSVRAEWTVGGMVTHFGHRHFRQNRYDARVAVDPVRGAWKIRSIEVLEQERVR